MKATVLILLIIGAAAALVAGSSGELGRLMVTQEGNAAASVISVIQGIFSRILTAAGELWEIVHLHHLGIWHAIVIILAVLIPRKIIVLLLR